jgi:TolA-binding protein
MAVTSKPVHRRGGGPRLAARAWLPLLTAGLLSGCVTSGQGEAMRTDISNLSARVEHLEKRGAEAEVQTERLRKILDEATALLSRNNADVGARVQKAEMDLGAVAGKLEEAKFLLEQIQKAQADTTTRLGALEQGQAKIVDRVAPAMAEDKDTLWKQAQERMTGGMREDARRFYRGYIQRFPQDPRTPQAYLEIGRSYALEAKHTQAVAEYNRVLEAFPKSPEVPEAMWLMAAAYVDLKFCRDATALLQDLGRRYPRSPRVNDAKVKLKEVQRLMKDKKACI